MFVFFLLFFLVDAVVDVASIQLAVLDFCLFHISFSPLIPHLDTVLMHLYTKPNSNRS